MKIFNNPKIFELLKKLKILAYPTVFVFLLLVAGLSFFYGIDLPGGYKFYAVQSGSMEPTISIGSVVVTKPSVNYQKGDIVTFKPEADRLNPKSRRTVTHRIVEIRVEKAKEELFVTKGDANKTQDADLLRKDLIIGKMILFVPYLGYIVTFTKTLKGLIILVIIPVTLIIYSELLAIKNEALRLVREKRKRKLTTKEKIEEKIGEEIIAVEKDVTKVEKELGKALKRKKTRKGSKA